MPLRPPSHGIFRISGYIILIILLGAASSITITTTLKKFQVDDRDSLAAENTAEPTSIPDRPAKLFSSCIAMTWDGTRREDVKTRKSSLRSLTGYPGGDKVIFYWRAGRAASPGSVACTIDSASFGDGRLKDVKVQPGDVGNEQFVERPKSLATVEPLTSGSIKTDDGVDKAYSTLVANEESVPQPNPPLSAAVRSEQLPRRPSASPALPVRYAAPRFRVHLNVLNKIL
ncbi:hypothetical protein FIBSPDRAFT_890291 [Athelia psychrophila]|uniref:Uncharacterized protein n=1 Tax=Athelia psychrophila TaxID=1759441 RepID=A0A166L862_9AGAM|nr:hypothetical protein FIBSPDRAFT_890291 [Fibularhizoctonia sp. CBS 109695]